jgi:hypothetical protein
MATLYKSMRFSWCYHSTSFCFRCSNRKPQYRKAKRKPFLCLVTCIEIRFGGWRKLHNEVLHNWYSFPNIIRQIKSRRMRWVGHVAHMEEERKMYRVLVGKPKGKRPLRRLRHRWENGIRMDLREIGCGVVGVDWIHLA